MLSASGKVTFPEIVHAFYCFSTVLFQGPFRDQPGAPVARMDVLRDAPYNEKNSYFRGKPLSVVRPEIHRQPSQNRLSHESQPAAERTQAARPVGKDEAVRAHPRNPERRAGLHLARWTTLRQWAHSPGPRPQ